MKLKNNQTGIAHVAIIVAVVVIAAIGVVGWKVWDNREKQSDTNSTAQTTQTNQQENSEEDTQADTKYLEIKEYGVKIVLTDGIEDAYYTIDPSPPATASGSPYLSVHSLDEYPNCKMIASVSKAKVGDEELTKEYLLKVSSFKMDDYYYWVSLSKGMSCIDDSKENNTDTRETQARKSFLEAKIEKL